MRAIRQRAEWRNDRGATALEFAIVAPLLLILIIGMLEFGLMYQAQLAVTHAAREGARLAAVDKYDAAIVAQRAFPLTTADGLAVALTQPDIESVRVTVTYPWTWRIIPLGGPLDLGDPPTLSSSATMRKE
jgi:Flp pilus assembly protein TadG